MYIILYVDDEPGLLEIGKIFLEQDRDFSIDTSISGQDALLSIKSRSYDAIISDYQMPGMDGIALLKEVRKQYGDIPFILFTGRGREEVVIEAINNGADFYLQKGGDPKAQFAELAHKVRQAVARKRAEHSLVESEKRLTDIINFLPDATFAIDKEGTVIAWNRAIEDMTGVPAGEMVGKGDYEYAIPFYGTRRKILIDLIFEPENIIAEHYANIHREKDVLIADTNLPRPKGERLWLMGKASPLYDRRGRIVGAIEAIRDITQLKTDAEQIARKTSALTIINRIIQASNRRQTVEEYSRNVLTLTIDLLHYSAGGVYLIDEERKKARLICSQDLDSEFVQAVDNIDIHARPFDTVFVRGEPVIVGNLGDVLQHVSAASGFHTTASIPIIAEDTVIGALNVTSRESSPISPEDQEVLVAVGRELGSAFSRIRAESAVRESESRLRYMLGFYERAERSEDEVRNYAVEGAGAVTGSPLSYLAFLNDDESVLTMYAWSKSAMKECSLREKPIIYPVEKTGLWGEAVRQRRPVITNDYEAPNPKKKGYPEGHPRIIRHMNVPVFDGDHIVIVAGVANRPTDYTENEARELTLLMQGLWHVLKRHRAEKELWAANEQLTASDEEMRSQFDELAESERRLRASDDRLSTFMESATDAFTIWDANLNLVDINRVALTYLPPGTHKDDVIGRNLRQFISGTDEWAEYSRYLEVLRTGIPFIGNEKTPEQRFGRHWLNVKCFRVGSGLGIITTDVTAQKEAELELRSTYEQLHASEEELRSQYEELALSQRKIVESEQQLAEITGSIPGVVYQFSVRPDGTRGFRYVSSRARDVFGISNDPDTFFDQITAGVDPDDRVAFLESIDKAVRPGVPWDFEGRFIRPDGTRIWFQGMSRPVMKDSGIVYNGVLLDITRRKKAEEERRESEEKYRSIIDHSPYGMHFYQLIRERGLVFTGANPGADRILKVPHDPCIGKTIEDAFPGLIGTEIPARYREVVETGAVWKTEQVVYHEGAIAGVFDVTAFRTAPGSMVAMFVDITERKKADDALFSSQQMLQLVLDTIPQRVFWKDRNSVFLGCNMPLALDAGFSQPSDIIGKTDYDHASHATADLYRADDRYVMETGESKINFEEPQIRPDGSNAWLRTSKVPLRDREGTIIGVLGTYEDITGQKQVMERLKESEERYRSLFVNSHAVMLLIDPDSGSIVDANPAASAFYGWSHDELVEKRIDEINTLAPKEVRAEMDAARSERRRHFLFRHRLADGSVRDVEVYSGPVQAGGRRLLHSIIFDITGRRQIEEVLRQKTEELDQYFSASLDLFCIADTSGYFRKLNPEWEKTLGYPLAELEGKRFLDFVHPDDLPATLAAIGDLSRQKEVLNFTNRFRHRDSTYRWIEWRSLPKGGLIFAAARDITDRVRMEEALRNSEERLRLFIRHAPAALAMFDMEMCYLAASRRWMTDYNLGDRDLTGCSHYEIFPELTDEIKAVHRRALAGEVVSADNDKFKRADGSFQWLSWVVRPWYTTGNAVGGIIIFSEDITQRKLAEEALRESEEKFRSLVEATSDFIWEVDENGIYTYVSPKVRDLIGYEAEEVIGRTPFDFMPPEEADRVGVEFHHFTDNRLPISSLENKNIHKNGSVVILETSGVPRFADDGRFIGYRGIDRDITRRKNAESEVGQVRDMLQALIDNSYDAIFITDKDFRILDMNARMLDLFCVTREEALSLTIDDLTGPESIRTPAEYRQIMDDVLSGKDQFISWQAKRPGDGSLLDAEVFLTRIYLEGVPVLLANVRDVSERLAVEKALWESEARLSSILRGTPALQFVIGRDHTILSWNKALEEYSGIRAADLVGTDQQWRAFYRSQRPVLADLLVDKNTDGLYKWYSGKLKPSRYVEGAYEAIDFFPDMGPSGTWLSFTAAPVSNAEGDVIGAIETLEDITEQKQMQDALLASEKKYRTILTNLQDAYFRTDEKGIIIMVNPAAARMYGYGSPEEMVGIPAISLYVRHEDRADVLRHLADADRKVTDFTGEGRRKDGSTFWVSLNVQAIRDGQGRIIGTEAMVRDTSERMTMERALREANKKLALLGSITRHDVANKVSIIKGFAQAAGMLKPSPEIAHFLDKIDSAGSDIATQIAFTKTYQELGMHEPAWQNIRELVARQKPEGFAITCTCDAVIFADPMLEKVINNLIDNAIRHGERVTEVTVSCEPGDGGLVITFSDNGVGVPDNLKEKIFESGFGKHTGFGLFLAREILGITGITIRETGTQGEGARFEIMVPEGSYR